MTVYAKIENNELVTAKNGYNGITGLADNLELCLKNGFTPFTEEEVSGYFFGSHKIIDGVLTDIRNTEEYKSKQTEDRKREFQLQIDEFDKKRIRAGFEPTLKDEASGQTWLEYYTLQIQDLRAQIAAL